MNSVIQKKGHGITERDEVVLSAQSPDEMVEAIRMLKDAHDDPLRLLRAQIEAARTGFNYWRAQNPDSRPEPETIEDLLSIAVRLSGSMEDHLQNGNVEWALRHAAEIGETLALARIKYQWEPDALLGRKVSKGFTEAAEKTNSAHGPLRDRRFARLRELLSQMNLESAVAACEAEGFGKAAAIKRQWNRHKNRDT